jgi:hypothetical protein
MSIIQTLSEGIVNRDLKKEGSALLSKWEATGLLEGLDTEQARHNMARLLENQAKELLRESSSMSAGDVEGFASVAFPIVRRVFAGLIANELVSVQPMSLPSGLIFFLDFVYSPNVAGQADQSSRFGNTAEKSIYGTNQVASQITGGVDIVGSNKENVGGLRQQVGYAYAHPTGSNNGAINNTHITVNAAFKLDGAVSEANAKLIQYDPDLLSITDSSVGVVVFEADIAEILDGSTDNLDRELLSSVEITTLTAIDAAIDALGGNPTAQIRRLTDRILAANAGTGNESLRFVVTAAGSDVTPGVTTKSSATAIDTGHITYPKKDTITSTVNKLGAIDGFNFPFEGAEAMPEIDIKVDSIAITATTKKLKAKWTPELGQDLNAYHNLDAEVELTSILSEQIALEIDRELLSELVNGATAATYYWSRSPGLFVNKVTGQELGASSAAPDFTGTVSEWYETLIETINDVSAQIHLKTLRGGANYIVCGPEVANILEFTSGFRANVTADADKGEIGAVKVGALSRKFDVIVDPYFPRNAILVGRKGGSFLESGFVYAPYVPLQTTPTIFGVEDFVPRKGVMTRYGKKMVRPDMYGLVIVRGLLGEEGSS